MLAYYEILAAKIVIKREENSFSAVCIYEKKGLRRKVERPTRGEV